MLMLLLKSADTSKEGLILCPDPFKSFKVTADADWAGAWHKDTAQDDPGSAKSRSGILLRMSNHVALSLDAAHLSQYY
jgi:hypothetical protein